MAWQTCLSMYVRKYVYSCIYLHILPVCADVLILCAKANQSADRRLSKVMEALQETSWHLPSEIIPHSNFYFRAVPVDQFSLSVHQRQLLT